MINATAISPNGYPHDSHVGIMSPTIPTRPKMTVNEPKSRPRARAARRCMVTMNVRLTTARMARNRATTATGFHSSSASHDGTPTAATAPEMRIAGWKKSDGVERRTNRLETRPWCAADWIHDRYCI